VTSPASSSAPVAAIMKMPEPALQEGVPDREIVARPAEVAPETFSSGAEATESSEAGAAGKSDDAVVPEGETEGGRSGKPAKPRRTGASRPRTRKPKSDTAADSATVPEDEVAKPDESTPKSDEPAP